MKHVNIISSKSDAHRAYILAGLSQNPCKVIAGNSSADIDATRDCMHALLMSKTNGSEAHLRCRESGSTLRFLLPVTGALGVTGHFYPEGRLPHRPLSPLYEELEKHGCRLSPAGSVPLTIGGQLEPGQFVIPGDVSSQYISGLLFALPLLQGDSEIVIEGQLQSAGYVRMTERTMERFGVKFQNLSDRILVTGCQTIQGPSRYEVEGDWSNAAFWLAMGVLSDEAVSVHGLDLKSAQGDKKIAELLEDFRAEIAVGGETAADAETAAGATVTAFPARGHLKALSIDARDIPDLVPVLAVVSAFAEGETVIHHAERLRMKESDRIKSTACMLRALGAACTERPDGLVIHGSGGQRLTGGVVDGFNDHRIVMAAAAGSVACSGKVEIQGSKAVEKSYPSFFNELKEVGLDRNVVAG